MLVKNMQSLALACVSSLVLAACQTSASKQLWEQSAAAGKALPNRDPALQHTVAIVDPDPSVGQFCTGVLIDKRHIITAAHCFEDQQRIPYVYLEKNYEANVPFDERGLLIRIELVAVHSRYQKARSEQYDRLITATKDPRTLIAANPPLHDIAIVLLENDVLPPYRPVKLVAGNEDLKTSRLQFAGYGCRGQTCDDSESELRKVDLQYLKTVDAYGVALSGRGTASCSGDSGGPVYRLDAQGLSLLALARAGTTACESGVVVDTLVAPYRAWIDQGMRVLARPMVEVDGYRVIDFTQENGER